eukprot:3923877-Rhodomonas_salina.1
MPAKRGAATNFDWDAFTSAELTRLPEGMHRTSFQTSTNRFRSALQLVEEGQPVEQAMARVRTDFNIPTHSQRAPAHCAEAFLKTFHAGITPTDPIRLKFTANEVTRLRNEATPTRNPAQA